MEKLFKILLILFFLALLGFILHALCVKKGYCGYMNFYDNFYKERPGENSYLEESAKCLSHPMKHSYSEWAFVNLNKYVIGGSWGTKGRGQCTWYLEDVHEYTLKGYFGYTTRKELEKKWKGKPKPKGFDEFFKQYPKTFYYSEWGNEVK